MTGTTVSTVYVLSHGMLMKPLHIVSIITTVFLMLLLRHREVRQLAQGHTPSKKHSYNLYPGNLKATLSVRSWDMSVAI